MSYLDDIIGALAGRAGGLGGYSPSPAASASIGGTANSPTPIAPIMSDPGPSSQTPPGAPTNITPPVAQTAPTSIAAAPSPATAPAPTKTQSDFTLPPVTMTPPPVAKVPFAQSHFSQAPQVQPLPMLQNSPMGGILGAQVARKQYPFLGMPAGGVGGVASGDY